VGQAREEPRNIDFRNFTFPVPAKARRFLPVPDKVRWMDTKSAIWVKLVNGVLEFAKGGPSITLDRVQYGYLTMRPQLDAMVVLDYHTGGSANWNFIYGFDLSSGSPKLLGWLETGSRAEAGLYRLFVANGGFVLDVNDPAERQANCCSAGFIRTTYEWKDGKFVSGQPMFGKVEAEPQPR